MRGRCGSRDWGLSCQRGALGRCGSRVGSRGSSRRPEEAAVSGASTAEGKQGTQPAALVVTSRRLAARGQHAWEMLGGTREATPEAGGSGATMCITEVTGGARRRVASAWVRCD
jgi:hypothetical protein